MSANPTSDLPDMEYDVRWEIELEASSPQEVAAIALAVQRDPDSLATHFLVRPRGSDAPWVSVDVANVPGRRPWLPWVIDHETEGMHLLTAHGPDGPVGSQHWCATCGWHGLIYPSADAAYADGNDGAAHVAEAGHHA